MANYLDVLEALDRHLRATPSGEVSTGYEMQKIAYASGLAAPGQTTAATWVGQLVDLGYVDPGHAQGGRSAIPRRVPWNDNDLQSFTGYRLTATGRQEADRLLRQRREAATDATLGAAFGASLSLTLKDADERALGRCLLDLRSALDDDRPVAAIGASKELVESACHLVLISVGEVPGSRASLPALFAQACAGRELAASDLGRSVAAAVQRLAELRNASGAGHGRGTAPEGFEMADARFAAATAIAIAGYLLATCFAP